VRKKKVRERMRKLDMLSEREEIEKGKIESRKTDSLKQHR